MLGIRYLKASPTTFVLQYQSGKVVRSGPGLSFFYFQPTSEIALVPLASTDAPFVFNEVTADFQDATIQGALTFRVAQPQRLAEALDYTITARGSYASEDPLRLPDRLVHAAQIAARSFTQQCPLQELLTRSQALSAELLAAVRAAPAVALLGVEVLEASVLSIKPTPEMAKALQADARESLLRAADEAVYARRNAAVEQERRIRENELQTEIAVEEKQRQIREAQMAAEIAVEQQRSVLVQHRVENERQEADARAYALKATLDPLREVDWRVLLAAGGGGDAKFNIALAFRELAENAARIGELNVSPDLLTALLRKDGK